MVFASPVVDDTSLAVQMSNLIGTVLVRSPVVAWPFVLVWLLPRLKGSMPYALAGALVLLNVVFVPVRQNDFGWEALFRHPDTSVRPFIRSELFEKGKTYRILSSRDGKTPMYDLIRSGALLDSEFFPESINRRSFADTSEYVRFLNKRARRLRDHLRAVRHGSRHERARAAGRDDAEGGGWRVHGQGGGGDRREAA